jgi:hypothetical protein
MRHASRLSALSAVLLSAASSALLLVVPAATMADSVVRLGPFRSVTLRNGGHVILRHASDQRVTLRDGADECTSATIVDGDRLVIDHAHRRCPRGQRPVVEILSPDVDGLRVMDGGTIQTRGEFPRKAELRVAVEQGGLIDLRSMRVDRVTAAVDQGGRILTRPQETLVASVAHGGAVTYWGSPRVTSSTTMGGVVARGAADVADRPLLDMDPATPAVPAVPPRRATRVRARI